MVGSREIKGKPHPEGYILAAKRLGVPLERCIVFEDSEAGIRAGKSAGALVVGVKYGSRGRQNISLADYQVDKLSSLDPEFLRKFCN